MTTLVDGTFESSSIFLANKTWFRLIKKASLSEVCLKDKPEKYKYRPSHTYFEGVLFLLITYEIEHLRAIGLSLNEQSRKYLRIISKCENLILLSRESK